MCLDADNILFIDKGVVFLQLFSKKNEKSKQKVKYCLLRYLFSELSD